MARPVIHYHRGDFTPETTPLCGNGKVWRSRHTDQPTVVTCQRCQASLRKRGMLPRLSPFAPSVADMAAQAGVQVPRPVPRPATVDPDDIDDHNNYLRRMGII